MALKNSLIIYVSQFKIQHYVAYNILFLTLTLGYTILSAIIYQNNISFINYIILNSFFTFTIGIIYLMKNKSKFKDGFMKIKLSFSLENIMLLNSYGIMFYVCTTLVSLTKVMNIITLDMYFYSLLIMSALNTLLFAIINIVLTLITKKIIKE